MPEQHAPDASRGRTAPSVTRSLVRVLRFQTLWTMLRGLVWNLLGLGLLGCVLADRLREDALAVALCVATGASVSFLAWLVGAQFRRWTLERFCREFRREFPQDHDGLDAALELERRLRRKDPVTSFQREYLEELRERYLAPKTGLLHQHVRLRRRKTRQWLLLLLLLVALAFFWMGRASWRKACAFLGGRPSLTLEFSPGRQVPLHQDVTVVATLRKGATPRGAVRLEFRGRNGGPVHREAMNPAGEGRWRLTLYDLRENLRVRAEDGRAVSWWQSLEVYVPPAPLEVRVVATPPEYTCREIRFFSGFEDLTVVEGEHLRVRCTMPPGEEWGLLQEDGEGVWTPLESPEFFSPRDQARYRPVYRRGEIVRQGAPFAVRVTPDYPPVVERKTPPRDGKTAPGEELFLHCLATDDYGLDEVRLCLAVDDRPETRRALWTPSAGESPREWEGRSTVELGELTPGQVVVGWLEVRDNRHPEANVTRDEPFFLSVEEPFQDDFAAANASGEDSGKKNQRVDVADLLAESKRLLRDTLMLSGQWGNLPLSEARRRQGDLERDLRTLSVGVRGRQTQIAAAAGVAALPRPMAEGFQTASRCLAQAADQAREQLFSDSRLTQQRALAALNRLAWMLAQNTRSMGSGGEGEQNQQGSSSGTEASGGESRELPDNQRGDRQMPLEELKKLLEAVEEMRGELQGLLPELSRDAEPILREQQRRLQELLPRAAALESARSARQAMSDAAEELSGASQALANDAVSEGRQRTERALSALISAQEALRQAQRQEAFLQMERLARQAGELSEKQQSLSGENRRRAQDGASPEERQAARKDQESLEREVERFRREARNSAGSLARGLPQVSDAMNRAGGAAGERIHRAQDRAKKALLYGRYDAAAQSQEDASLALGEWSRNLARALEALPLHGVQELSAALEELSRMRNALTRAGEGRDGDTAAARRQVAEGLGRMGRVLGMPRLVREGEAIGQDSLPGALERLQQIQRDLSRELQTLREDALQSPALRSAPPPRKYRPQTQEYFRLLNQ